MDWDAITPELEKKLDPKHVRTPQGNFGPKGAWVEAWHVIGEANRIFGFGGWSYEVLRLSQEFLVEGKDRHGNVQWKCAYTCLVRVRVEGVIRDDVGFGSGFAVQAGDAIEGACKEAVTDALKRALRTFGNVFGLALYDKSRANVGVDKEEEKDEPKINVEATRDRIHKALERAWKDKGIEGVRRTWKEERAALDALRAANIDAYRQLVAVGQTYHTMHEEAQKADDNAPTGPQTEAPF